MQQIDDRIRREHEGFSASEDVVLIHVDARDIGASQYYFSPTPVLNSSDQQVAPVSAGITYTVVPMTTDGWEWSSSGELPKPVVRFHLAMEDATKQPHVAALLALLEDNQDLVGAKVYRTITKRRFLDDGSDPDPQANTGTECYTIEQKQAQTPKLLEFLLTAALDTEGTMLPRGQILDRCRRRYRVSDGQGGFEMRSCPYAGAAMFDSLDQPTANPSEDRCSRSLSGCQARHASGETLPFAGFPAASRVGVT